MEEEDQNDDDNQQHQRSQHDAAAATAAAINPANNIAAPTILIVTNIPINMANASAGRTVTSDITLTGGTVEVTGNIVRTGEIYAPVQADTMASEIFIILVISSFDKGY